MGQAKRNQVILAIDQGTTSSRTLAFTPSGKIVASAQQEFPQHFPKDGWVEHDPEDIWQSVLSTLRDVYDQLKEKELLPATIGITNQRETTVIWERDSGKPIYNAIVWQDRRTAEMCRSFRDRMPDAQINAKTGLLHDAYFSASKAAWLLENIDGAKRRAERGELCFGTIDSFLIYRLTGGASHVTDATNASRTNLFNIHDQDWDPDLLTLFGVDASLLPEVRDSSDEFGVLDEDILGTSLPVQGVAGDQQAALFGQACFAPGDIKSTYGTGCFVVVNTGETCAKSKNRLLSTIGYRLDGQVTYALEGSIFIAGAAVQWLRDEVGLIDSASQTDDLAAQSRDEDQVYLVPAFTGLGAPHWDPDARGALTGLTRGTSRADIVRAALDSIALQTYDLTRAMQEDGVALHTLRVDGGMVANDWMMQRLSDILDLPVERPDILETTALGAAFLAGLKAGIYGSLDEIASQWSLDRSFDPSMAADERDTKISGWQRAVERVLSPS